MKRKGKLSILNTLMASFFSSLELKVIKDEVEELKLSFPKLVEKTQENQAAMLDQIQIEVKSLKTLLTNRAKNASSSIGSLESASPLPFQPVSVAGVDFSSKPAIPAWQLSALKTNTPGASVTPPPPLMSMTDSPVNDISLDNDEKEDQISPLPDSKTDDSFHSPGGESDASTETAIHLASSSSDTKKAKKKAKKK